MRTSSSIPSVFLIVGCFTLSTIPALAQPDEEAFERLTTQDGLPGNFVTGIVQDRQGFMWFATNGGGLSKYDGYEFTTYRHDALDATSLAHNQLGNLYIDSRGTLWVAHIAGLDRFDPVTETFTHFIHDPVDSTSLSGNGVAAILEDREGTLWVGTHGGGLNRFDRDTETFTHFRYDPDDPTSLSGKDVRVLYEDRQGTLWVGTGTLLSVDAIGGEGLNRFDRATGTFTRYQHDPDDEHSLIDNRIGAIYEDSQGTFWVGTWGDGLHVMDREKGTFTRYTYDPAYPNQPHGPRLASGLAAGTGDDITTYNDFCVCFLHEDHTGALWIGGFGGVNRYDRTAGTLTHYEHGDFNWANTDFRIYESREGALWIGTLNGLYRIPPQASRFELYTHEEDDPNSLSDNAVLSALEDASGALWIGTFGGGLDRLETETGTFIHYRYDPGNSNSLSGDSVTVVYEAPSEPGVLWIGTQGKGLNRFEKKTGTFTHYRHDRGNLNSLSSDVVTAIYEAPSEPGVLWIGSEFSGLSRFDLATESFTSFTPLSAESYRPELLNMLDEFDREGRSIAALLGVGNDEDRSHPFEIAEETPVLVVALGEHEGGNSMYDYGWIEDGAGEALWQMSAAKTRAAGGGANNRIQLAEVHLEPGSYRLRYHSDGNTSYEDNWLGMPLDEPERWGIQVYSLQGRAALLIDEDVTDIQLSGRISNSTVYSILEDSAGTLWLGTLYGGLNALDRESGIFTSYLPGSLIYDIHEDREGRFWLGSDDGLLLVDRHRGRQSSEIESSDAPLPVERVGLEGSIVRDILEDESGILWIHSNNGLVRYDPGAQTFTQLNTQGLETNYPVGSTRSQRGELFFAGYGGLLHFYPGQVVNTTPPTTVLKGLRIFNEPVVPGPDSPLDMPVGLAHSITLTHAQRDFTIDYVGLHYGDPSRNRYRYRLEGYDEDWVEAGLQRSIRYSGVPPGSYTFRLKAANSDGVWSEEVTLGVTVLPPWWRTWWAYVGYGLLFAVGLFAMDRFQRKRLIAKERLRAEHEKAQALESTNRVIEATNTELQRALKHLTETQDQLIHTEKMASLGQLTAGIAHEIKNPLNFVNNFAEINAELLRELLGELTRNPDSPNPDSRIGHMQQIIEDLQLNEQKINEHGRRADGIIRAMLEHSRTEPGERQAVDVNKLLDEYVNLAYHGVRAREDGFTVDLHRGYDEAVGAVELVPQEIGRVFINLLDNAFYAVNEKRLSLNGQYAPEVSVRTERKDGGVEVRISDNGTGVPQEVRDKIFEPFFTTKPAGSGTGLGLSLSYDIVVKGHGGMLTVESLEGEGATFIMTLPVGSE